jgi:hypothetical protein
VRLDGRGGAGKRAGLVRRWADNGGSAVHGAAFLTGARVGLGAKPSAKTRTVWVLVGQEADIDYVNTN